MPAPKPIPEPIAKKPPSKELQAIYGPIIDKAINLLLTQPSQAKGRNPPASMEYKFPEGHKYPEGWPIARIVKKEGNILTRRVLCEKIVLFGYLYLYTKWHPQVIMKYRAPAVAGLYGMDKELDVWQL